MNKLLLFFDKNRILPFLFTLALIFILSHQPGNKLPSSMFLLSDKLLHSIEYGFLAATFIFWRHPKGQKQPAKTFILSAFFCIIYAISDEFHQSFIPLREATVSDVIADGIGAIISSGIWWWRIC